MDGPAAAESLALLREAAIREGLLAADDPPPVDGIVSDAAAEAIETLVARLPAPAEPDDEACQRWYAAHGAQLAQGEQVRLRHVLFAVTPGVDVDALRAKAESVLLDLRARGRDAALEDGRFAAAARQWSNCPSGAAGGELGWLGVDDCAPEFGRELFARSEIGVLPRLVASRFGLHVVEVLERRAGAVPDYDSVRDAVRARLRQQAWANGVRSYVRELAGAEDTAV